MKKILTLATATLLAMSMCIPTFAYQRLNTTDNTKNWRWEDWDDDGVYECYYYKDNGNRGFNLGTTPDGYELNQAGQWIVNGVVQTRTKEETTSTTESSRSADYDPAHPLAGKIDEWNLRLPHQYVGQHYICNNNLQAMLTGQMDQYYMPPVGYSTDSLGNNIYTSQEAIDTAKTEEQALYNWFCNWLNGMNFETMSEMEKAQEIQKVLYAARYDYDNVATGSSDYRILIGQQGVCGDFAMTAMSLAKALGLKAAINGTGDHAVYYIQIDGQPYIGSNNLLNLWTPTSDAVYFD